MSVMEKLTHSRATMSREEANYEIYRLLKEGVKVTVTDPDGEGETDEDPKGDRLGESREQRLLSGVAVLDRRRDAQTQTRCNRFYQRLAIGVDGVQTD